jgi:ADP-ribose pyrophosphatase YjhB (NUDIX family)
MNKIIIVSGPVIVEGGKVLLVKHGDTPFWKFCGGKVDNFTTDLKENAAREAKEEVGVELDFADEPPFLMYVQKETPQGLVDVLLVHWLAKRIGEVTPGEHTRECQWIDLQALPSDLGPNILPALKHFRCIG